MNILHIARRELRASLQSPGSYILGAGFLFVVGFFFANYLYAWSAYAADGGFGFEEIGVLQGLAEPFFGTITILLVFFLPTLTMRSLAEEQRSGSLALLLSSPVSSWEIVLGKWLGLMGFFAPLLLVGTLWFPATLFGFAAPPLAPVLAGALGVLLTLGLGCALGVAASALSGSVVIAAVLSWSGLLLLWLLGFLERSEGLLGDLGRMVGLEPHIASFAQGLIRSNDLTWFGLVTLLFLLVAQQRVEAHRWR
jgi:ABC-2 type transport system permease protein